MAKFESYLEENPDMQKDYREWVKEQGEAAQNEEPDWAAFRKYSQQQGHVVPETAPSDLLDIHAKITSGLLGGTVGKVTDTVTGTVGNVLGGVTGATGGSGQQSSGSGSSPKSE